MTTVTSRAGRYLFPFPSVLHSDLPCTGPGGCREVLRLGLMSIRVGTARRPWASSGKQLIFAADARDRANEPSNTSLRPGGAEDGGRLPFVRAVIVPAVVQGGGGGGVVGG